MSAPNSPCSTAKPRSRQWAMKTSYRGMARSGGGVGIQGELGDHQQTAAHLLQISVHLSVFILEDTEIADFLRQLHGGIMGVAGADAQQDQEALADLPVDLPVNGDGGMADAGNNCAHGRSLLKMGLSPRRGRQGNRFISRRAG